MTNKKIEVSVALAPSVFVLMNVALAAQDKYTLKFANGITFSGFRHYESCQTVAVSQTDSGIKAILASTTMIKAYREGAPDNGKPFPDDSKIVKIEWNKGPNPVSPYSVNVPGPLKSVSFIERDSKRFPGTRNWEYAQFLHDPATKTFKPSGTTATVAKTFCYHCHTLVKQRDYIFTHCVQR